MTVSANAGGATPVSRTIGGVVGAHSVVVTEQKQGDSQTTQQLSIYVDGALMLLPVGTGNVYGGTSDAVGLPHVAGTAIDEYEFWPRDLSADPELLCENGWDGEWNPATGVCLLSAN